MRIYLDKQIFSHLFKQEKVEYINLLKQLIESKSHNVFCYSHAHLLDLANDETNIKYEELDFIESLVEDNYISYDAVKKITKCYLARPVEAFKEVEEETNFNLRDFFDDTDENLSIPERSLIKSIKDILTTMTIDTSFFNTNSIHEDYKDIFNRAFRNIPKSMPIIDLFDNFKEVIKTLQVDRTIYRDLRAKLDSTYNNGKYTIDYNNIDFNDDLKNSDLKITFTEFVKQSLPGKETSDYSKYDFFTLAYFSLDLLGISKEPSKKVKFRNVLNDALHSYYGAYADVVVSDDVGFIKKTRTLYRLLEVETKVLELQDFINNYKFVLDCGEKTFEIFSDLLSNDLSNGFIISKNQSLKFNRSSFTIKPLHWYFGHFNLIDDIIEDSLRHLYFYKIIKNYSNFEFYKEYQQVVNTAVNLFGIDDNFRSYFNWTKEKEEISNKSWSGRIWKYNNVSIRIENNIGTEKMCMIISFKN